MELNENMVEVSFEVGPNFCTFLNTIFNPSQGNNPSFKQAPSKIKASSIQAFSLIDRKQAQTKIKASSKQARGNYYFTWNIESKLKAIIHYMKSKLKARLKQAQNPRLKQAQNPRLKQAQSKL